jgi:uncharacterized repeat protein (TIGR03847 family)
MSEPLELDPAEFITIGTIGPPGNRVFYLQAGRQRDFVTLVIEKEHAASLAAGIVQILGEVAEKLDRKTPPPILEERNMALREPIKPLFRVAQMGLGYDNERDQMVLVAQELILAGEEDLEEGDIEPRVVRFFVSREDMLALSQHSETVVASGRPICGNCGRPIDADGHFCPKSNGHGRKAAWA